MSTKEFSSNIKHLHYACDAMAQAAYEISQTNDLVAHAALVTLEGMLDDLAARVEELRDIRSAMDKLKEERDGVC